MLLEAQKIRLKNRIDTCEKEIKIASSRCAEYGEDLRWWKNELAAAKAELHGMQLELNLRCSTCGD